VEFLINLTEVIRLHVDAGVTKVADVLRRYLQSVKDYDDELTKKGLGTKCFVGRENEIANIMDTLKKEDKRKGRFLFLNKVSSFLSCQLHSVFTVDTHRPMRIRVRIDFPHPLVCLKRRLNVAVLRMRPEKPRSRVTAGVAR
jgi:hypothetical protein